jgi:prephenate dehydratase
MTKLESYQLEGSFNATMFYADVEGHPEERPLRLALEELEFHSAELILLGTYPASPFRQTLKKQNGEEDDAPRWRSAI